MGLSYFLAQLFGFTLIIFSIIALVQPSAISAVIRDMKPFSFPLLLAGFLGVFGGLAIVLSHNIWEMGWRVVITLFGWTALVKGITYVVFPGMLMRTGVGIFEGKWRLISFSIMFLLGCYLVYRGFGA